MRKLFSRVLVVGTVLAAMSAALVAHAQTAQNITMAATGTETLTGTVVITPTGANTVKVDISIKGFKPNDARASHIHSPGQGTGACDSGGPVVYPLSNVVADASGNGTSSSTVTFDPAKGIPTNKWYVNVHAGTPTQVGAGVICGLITAPLAAAAPAGAAQASPAAGAAAAPAAAAAQPGGLPKTGGATPTALMLGVLALVGLVLAGGGMVFARRRA